MSGLLGFPLFVFFTLPFYGIANSSNIYDRVEGCLTGSLWFGPVFVLLIATCISAFRMTGMSNVGRILSVVLFTAYIAYGAWLLPMMLRGPIRGF